MAGTSMREKVEASMRMDGYTHTLSEYNTTLTNMVSTYIFFIIIIDLLFVSLISQSRINLHNYCWYGRWLARSARNRDVLDLNPRSGEDKMGLFLKRCNLSSPSSTIGTGPCIPGRWKSYPLCVCS